MNRNETTVYTVTTPFAKYEVVDMTYDDRPARVLFSGDRTAAQSGMPRDDKPELLFDYNQRFFELVDSVRPRRVLLVGGGAFTLPSALLKAFPELAVDVVEPDAELDDIAERFFEVDFSRRLRVFHTTGLAFLKASKITYDLIVVDAFNDITIPDELKSALAIKQLARHLNPDGLVAINIISSYYGRNAELIRQQYALYKASFQSVDVFPASHSILSFWLPQNFILVAQKGKLHELELRFAALEPPEAVEN